MNGLFYRRDIGVDLSKAYMKKMAVKKNVIQVKLWLWYLRKHANVDVDGVMNFTHLSTGPDHTKSLCLKRKSINDLEDIYIMRTKWIFSSK